MHLRKPNDDTEGRLARALENPIFKQNAYETQLQHLREQVRNDPNYFYTYSPEFMSLSVDPYTADEVRRQQEADHKSKFTVPQGFDNVLKRKKEETIRPHKYLPQSAIEDLKNFPYHEEKAWVAWSNVGKESTEPS